MMRAMQTFAHKRGDTFNYSMFFGSENDKMNLSGLIIRAQMKDARYNFVCDFVVLIDYLSNTFRLSLPDDLTLLWTPGAHLIDIMVRDSSGAVNTTETFGVNVVQRVTDT